MEEDGGRRMEEGEGGRREKGEGKGGGGRGRIEGEKHVTTFKKKSKKLYKMQPLVGKHSCDFLQKKKKTIQDATTRRETLP
jgi:hypothetical protein